MSNRAGHLATCALLAALGVGVAGSPPLAGNPAVCACRIDVDNPGGEVLDSLADTLDNIKERLEQQEEAERTGRCEPGIVTLVIRG